MSAGWVVELMREHRLIDGCLDALDACVIKMMTGSVVTRLDIADFADFFGNYADTFHHGKEEQMLFVAMERHGVPANTGPLSVMLAEHAFGRERVAVLFSAGSGHGDFAEQERRMIATSAQEFSKSLRSHIQKEDRVLYPMAEQVIPVAEQIELLSHFSVFDEKKGQESARLELLAAKLSVRFLSDEDVVEECSGCNGCPNQFCAQRWPEE